MKCSQIHTASIQDLHMDMILLKILDMGFNEMFLDHHFKYTGPTCGSSSNKTVGHGFQRDVLRSSLQVYWL